MNENKAFEEFENSRDWSLYKDYEKRKIAYEAGQRNPSESVEEVLEAARNWGALANCSDMNVFTSARMNLRLAIRNHDKEVK